MLPRAWQRTRSILLHLQPCALPLPLRPPTASSSSPSAAMSAVPSASNSPASSTSSAKAFAFFAGSPARPSTAPVILQPVSSASDTLLHLLWRDLQDHKIEFGDFYSNHLAHGVVALHQLGAPPERLIDFWPHASERLEHLSAAAVADAEMGSITRNNWFQHVGHGIGWASWLAFFRDEWKRIEKEQKPSLASDAERARLVERQLLNEYVPVLAPFISGHATHPLIHLGFSQVLSDVSETPLWLNHPQQGQSVVDAALPVEPRKPDLPGHNLVPVARMNPMVLSGLSYLCYHGLNLGCKADKYSDAALAKLSAPANSKPLLQLLPQVIKAFTPFIATMEAKIKQSPYVDMNVGNFQRRVQVVADHGNEHLYEIDAQWHIGDDTGAAGIELQHLALFLYGLSPNDFFMLHGVTSVFAFRHLLPHIEMRAHQQLALRYALKTLIAVFVVQHMPEKDSEAIAMAVSREDGLVTALRSTMKANPEHLQQDWSVLTKSAIQCSEEHTQKLVWACLNEYQRLSSQPDNEANSVWKDWCKWCAAKRIAAKDEVYHY